MRKLATILVATAALALVAGSAMAAGQALRISQVYGGGGNTGAQYNQDFIEILNASGLPVDISNWAVEYASASGSWGTSFVSGGATFWNYVVFPAGTVIPPCGYILIGGANDLGRPAADPRFLDSHQPERHQRKRRDLHAGEPPHGVRLRGRPGGQGGLRDRSMLRVPFLRSSLEHHRRHPQQLRVG